MARKLLLVGTILCGISVALGAFGAHGLKALIPPEKLVVFETGVRYQFMHAIALIILGVYLQSNHSKIVLGKRVNAIGSFFLIGILFFSGSIYTIALQPLMSVSLINWVGPITPMGGLCFMIGWTLWARTIYLDKVDN